MQTSDFEANKKVDIALQTTLDFSKTEYKYKDLDDVDLPVIKSLTNPICNNNNTNEAKLTLDDKVKTIKSESKENITASDSKTNDRKSTETSKKGSFGNTFSDGTSMKLYPYQNINDSFANLFIERALKIFIKYCSKEVKYVDESQLIFIFKDLLSHFKIEIPLQHLENALKDINDFIPKKITEQVFLDIFQIPKLIEFFSQHSINLNLQTARFAGLFGSTPQHSGSNTIKTCNNSKINEENNFSIHNISIVSQNAENLNTNDSFSKMVEKNLLDCNKENTTKRALITRTSSRHDLETNKYANNTNNGSESKRYSKYFHSLNNSEITTHQDSFHQSRLKNTAHAELKTNSFENPYYLEELYIKDSALDFQKLLPYSTTPPRPIFNKESHAVIIKDLVQSHAEYGLLLSLLSDLFFLHVTRV